MPAVEVDTLGMGVHQHHPARSPRVDVVAIVVVYGQTCDGGDSSEPGSALCNDRRDYRLRRSADQRLNVLQEQK